MKCFLTLLVLFINAATYSQTAPNKFDLKEFTPFDSNELKFDQIQPDGEYLYWRCLSTDAYSKQGKERMVAEFGNQKYAKRTKNTYSKRGFLVGCGPGLCYYYIVAIRKDKTVELIDRDEGLKSFIGKVDNVEEVKILARANRLYVNLKNLNTGSYRKMDDDYLLYLFDYMESCLPGDGSDEQSVKASLTSKGEFTLIDRRFIFMRNKVP
jgi:hypothetical protein